MISNEFKVLHFLPSIANSNGIYEYYNLKKDPGETIDLSRDSKYEEEINILLKKLNALTGESIGRKLLN